jgi:DNA-binding NarL/FixJ family response regulator
MRERPATESRSPAASLIGGDGSAAIVARLVPLSRREREGALLIAAGLPNRQIAARLEIRERTVEDHVSRLLKKLKVTSRAQVMLWAITTGLVGLPGSAPVNASPGDGTPQ